ncbi:ABC transporter ATP-binding protein [Erythrobacter sp. THAF29]|uniref:ABC transporter ATP-binding protein n=1 Tax=Erythrobacter sp. THAF29 TaxID=2587851 RepID=UPI001267E516|nr:ABC transporter ATP-binding protein [Erythrobacter sp. THAF29]QFT75982.1 Lipid A export ATP-binding/permease protein MsbA [Erythrobacter sp. THAF29]
MDFGFVWRHARQFRGELLLISGLTIASSLATLAVPWIAGQLLGDIVEGTALDGSRLLGLLVVALVGLTGLNIAATIASASASLRILGQIRKEVYEHIFLMPMAFHDKRSTGDLLALMTYEANNLSSFLASTLANAPSMVLTAGGAVVLLFLIDPAMALVVPILIPVFFVLMKLLGKRLRVLAKHARQAEVNVIATAESDLAVASAIKAFASEEHYRARYAQAVEKSQKFAFRQAKINAFVGPIVALIAALAAVALLVLASGAVASGERSAGDLFAFLLYAALLTRPVGSLADMYGRFQIARGTLARLQDVIEMPPETGYTSGEAIDRATGAIRIRDIRFSYPGRPPVLTGLSLDIKPGEIVALTGDNGVGKSTLVKLLLRFYAADEGSIEIDGKDISGFRVQDLRRQFGYVPQRPLLFNGSIADNIVFGQGYADPTKNTDAIERAVRLAQAESFVARLPERLKTQIGDHGIRLSGGQGQRIALARALFRDPPIYILDEATSMYDMESEAAFVEDCVDALRDRTVIIITHRQASLALADRILRVSPEKVIEIGLEEA